MSPRIVLRGILALAVSLLLSAGAQAQPMPAGFQATAFRAYLSGSGNDANPCTLVAPCRLLPRAISVVADGGEVWMLDSANYNSGPVNIDRSVTILAVPGALGSVVALGGNAIDITTAGVKVALRNLVIVPLVGGGGTNGIVMTASAASLTVENCLVANMPGSAVGIYVNANGASVLVTDTVIRGNWFGLYVANGAHATVTRTTVSGGGYGVGAYGSAGTTTTLDMTDSTVDWSENIGVHAFSSSASGFVKVSVRNSQIVRGRHDGISAESLVGGLITLSTSSNVISNNGTSGIVASGAGVSVWASGNTISDNNTGLKNGNSAVLESAGDNAVRNNGTISPIAPM